MTLYTHTPVLFFFFPRVSLDFIIELYSTTTNAIYLSTIVRQLPGWKFKRKQEIDLLSGGPEMV